MGFEEDFEKANQRAKELEATVPKAISARYDQHRRRIIIGLSNGLELGFSPAHAQGLEAATPAQLKKIEISHEGYGLHFPAVDADLYLPTLLQGTFGSRRWMAAHFGKAGGLSRSRKKTAASRRNGKLGGRPRSRHK
jgi:hypothetical protein